MSDYIIHDSTLSGIADAIREKTGRSDAIPTVDMADEIMSISGGSANIWIGTQAELEEDFDELEDGTQINIIDDEEKVSANGTMYSLDEKCIGLWVNNKPLYQKTITFGALPNNSAKSVAHNISNIDNIVDIKGFAYSTTNGYTLPLEDLDADTTGTTGNIRLYADSTNVYIKTKSDQTTYDTVYITLQYTKTTDSPLNGIMPGANTMYIAGSDCFSTEEKEIGCWIDGKPLYQVTVNLGQLTNDSNWHFVSLGINNLDKVVEISDMYMMHNTSSGVDQFFPMPNYRPNSQYGISFYVDDGQIAYINNWLDLTSRTGVAYVTVKYTKTTDTAGSGRFVPSGDKAVHYSSNEKVVGTWINNKPLYEKTIFIESPTRQGYYNHGISDIDIAMIRDIAANRDGSNWICNNFFASTSDFFCCIISRGGQIWTNYGNGNTISNLYVTLRYTKTTD